MLERLGLRVGVVAFATITLIASSALALQIDPPRGDFGPLPVGGSASIDFTITNDGELPITLGDADLTLSGTNPNQFVLAGPGRQVTLMPGDTLDVTVAYQPVSGGTHSARLEVAPGGVKLAVCELQGSGVSPQLEIPPEPLDFGAVLLGETARLTLGLKVPGGAAIGVDLTAITSTNPAFVVDLSDTRRHLDPGATTTFGLTFVPSQPGLARAQIPVEVALLPGPLILVDARGTGVATADAPVPKLIPVGVAAAGCALGGAARGGQPLSAAGRVCWALLGALVWAKARRKTGWSGGDNRAHRGWIQGV